MRVLVGCECSGVVRDTFSNAGHDAWSCDLKPTESKQTQREGKHYQGNVLEMFDLPNYGGFDAGQFDLAIFHPDCDYLTNSGVWALKDPDFIRYPGMGYHQKVNPRTLVGSERRKARDEAINFFLMLTSLPVDRIAIENPIGCMSSEFRKPDQTIHPWQFGSDASKATCLWLKNLPLLKPTKIIFPRIVKGKKRWGNQTDSGQNNVTPSETRKADRAITYPGIAQAMAEQWGDL